MIADLELKNQQLEEQAAGQKQNSKQLAVTQMKLRNLEEKYNK